MKVKTLFTMNVKIVNIFIPVLVLIIYVSCQTQNITYVCTPCNLACDTLIFQKPGICPHCQMALVKSSEIVRLEELEVDSIDIQKGSGVFVVEGGMGKKGKPIGVYYYMPQNYHPDTKILMVIPGAGRDGDEYRDAWIDAAEQYNLLILSLQYRESMYDFTQYHMCGLMHEWDYTQSFEFVENSNNALLDESSLQFEVNDDPNQWIFKDFDRIFDQVVTALNGNQTTYDMFGHSAGGQILHRLALFYPENKAEYIIAANSGFYTHPDFERGLPFGMEDTPIPQEQLASSFANQLVLLLGELDNENEDRGTLLRSETADQRGLHRYARGKYFFDQSQKYAEGLGYTFRWELKVVPNVGHDFRKMSQAAADYLYGES